MTTPNPFVVFAVALGFVAACVRVVAIVVTMVFATIIGTIGLGFLIVASAFASIAQRLQPGA